MTISAHAPERHSGKDWLALLNRTPVNRIEMTPRSGNELGGHLWVIAALKEGVQQVGI